MATTFVVALTERQRSHVLRCIHNYQRMDQRNLGKVAKRYGKESDLYGQIKYRLHLADEINELLGKTENNDERPDGRRSGSDDPAAGSRNDVGDSLVAKQQGTGV